jgi:hypothetical protein|nr:MAG TPA: hypothetical protein [Caudoviricetes sp.]
MIENRNIKLKSYDAILNFTGNKINFQKKLDVVVLKNNISYLYKDVTVIIDYQVSYMQYKLSIIWEDDSNQLNFKDLNLRGDYNTNFNKFFLENENLVLTDDNGVKITVMK